MEQEKNYNAPARAPDRDEKSEYSLSAQALVEQGMTVPTRLSQERIESLDRVGANVILDQVSSGVTLSAIARSIGCSRAELSRYLRLPAYSADTIEAMADSADALADQALTLLDDADIDDLTSAQVSLLRARSECRMKLAAYRRPSIYLDRLAGGNEAQVYVAPTFNITFVR